MVTDDVVGLSLSAIMEESRTRRDGERGVPVPIALRIVSDVLSGLSCLHEAFARTGTRRIHGEVGPAAILVGADGRSRLQRLGGWTSAEMRAGSPSGSDPSFRSPEHWLGDEVDERSDMFSAGVLLWELVAGRRLFSGSREEILASVFRGDAPMAGGTLRLAPELYTLTRRALDPRPTHRFSSAYSFARAVHAMAYRFGLSLSHDVVAEYLESRFADELRVRRAVDRHGNADRRGAYRELATTGPTATDGAADTAVFEAPGTEPLTKMRTSPMAIRTTVPLSQPSIETTSEMPLPTRARSARFATRAAYAIIAVTTVIAALSIRPAAWLPSPRSTLAAVGAPTSAPPEPVDTTSSVAPRPLPDSAATPPPLDSSPASPSVSGVPAMKPSVPIQRSPRGFRSRPKPAAAAADLSAAAAAPTASASVVGEPGSGVSDPSSLLDNK